jgi:LPS O-antigen subunit length determinant protein (WzzB/FepE family)
MHLFSSNDIWLIAGCLIGAVLGVLVVLLFDR